MNKKITFVCNHLYGGGAERVLVSLANYFDLQGYSVNIIVFDGTDKYPINESISITEIGDSSSLWKQSREIRRRIQKNMPDIIISFEYFVNLATIIAARGLKPNVIVSERNDPARIGAGLGKDQLRNILYRFCDSLVCQTPDAKEYFPDVIQCHTVIIANPIMGALPIPYQGKRKHTVVNFCRINKQKNLDLLIDSFEEFIKFYNDYNLEIYGDGPEKDRIQRIIDNKKLNEKISLKPNSANVHDLIKDCSMFVSSSDYEGLSNSMLEAMAIGLPTICTDCPCGGARMIIQDGKNGLLVPVGNKQKMVEAMKMVASNEDLSLSLSMEGRKLRDSLSIQNIAQKWELLF